MTEANKIYDSIIVGGGSAGITAAIYLKRKGRDIAIFADAPGGQIMDTAGIENYPGFSSIQGYELTEKLVEHLKSLGVNVDYGHIDAIEKKESFELKKGDEVLKSKTVIWATGAKRRLLGIPGEEEYQGRGVSYCSICDAPFYHDKKVAVIGGGNSGVEAAMDLEKVASEVYLICISDLSADKILVDQVENSDKINILTHTNIQEILGERMVKQIRVIDEKGESFIEVDGVFVEIGLLPNTDVVKDFVDLNDRGEIIIDKVGKTNVEGFYACGDVTNGVYKQIVIAAGEGAEAGLSADDYLNKNN